jgi:hypothetical protein
MASSSSSIKVAMDTTIYRLYYEMIWNEMTKCERKHKKHEMKEKNYNKNDQIKAPFVLNS